MGTTPVPILSNYLTIIHMTKFLVIYMFFVICFTGCSGVRSNTEKLQKKRNKIVNVQNDIVDIKNGALFGKSLLYIIDEYLVLLEVASKTPRCIYLFEKNDIISTYLLIDSSPIKMLYSIYSVTIQ